MIANGFVLRVCAIRFPLKILVPFVELSRRIIADIPVACLSL